MKISTYEILMLIHYYHQQEDFNDQVSNVSIDCHSKFLGLGLLENTEYGCTRKWKANREALLVYMDALCNVPLPVRVEVKVTKWEIPKV